MIMSEAWIFFNPIFGRKERIFLWTVLYIQAILWTVIHFYLLIMLDSQISGHFTVVSVRVSAFMVLIYLYYIRKKIRADENRKKFKLFQKVYLYLFFYFLTLGTLGMNIFFKLTLFVPICYICEPKKLNAILSFAYEREELDEDLNDCTFILE